jgi:hypothetical protein
MEHLTDQLAPERARDEVGAHDCEEVVQSSCERLRILANCVEQLGKLHRPLVRDRLVEMLAGLEVIEEGARRNVHPRADLLERGAS